MLSPPPRELTAPARVESRPQLYQGRTLEGRLTATPGHPETARFSGENHLLKKGHELSPAPLSKNGGFSGWRRAHPGTSLTGHPNLYQRPSVLTRWRFPSRC